MKDAKLVEKSLASADRNGGDGLAVIIREEHQASRPTAHSMDQSKSHDAEQAAKSKSATQPWVWALLGVLAIAVISCGVAYYLNALGYESTDDAFIDGHVVPISSRVAGHVAYVYVTDNQLVKQGDPLVELDPRDFDTRVAGTGGAGSGPRGQTSKTFGCRCPRKSPRRRAWTKRWPASRGKAEVTTALAAVSTAKSQMAAAQAQWNAAKAALKQVEAEVRAAEAEKRLTPRTWNGFAIWSRNMLCRRRASTKRWRKITWPNRNWPP